MSKLSPHTAAGYFDMLLPVNPTIGFMAPPLLHGQLGLAERTTGGN